MVRHRARVKQLDEKGTRHSKDVGGALGCDDLVLRDEGDSLAVRHEPDRCPQNLKNGLGQLNSFPGRVDQSRDATIQQPLDCLHLLLL